MSEKESKEIANITALTEAIENLSKKINDLISNDKIIAKEKTEGLDAITGNTNLELAIYINNLNHLIKVRGDLISTNNIAKLEKNAKYKIS